MSRALLSAGIRSDRAAFWLTSAYCQLLLGGSGVVISRVISPLIWAISIVTLLITLLTTTNEPPSSIRLQVPQV